MSQARRFIVVAALLCAAGTVLVVKHRTAEPAEAQHVQAIPNAPARPEGEPEVSEALPRLVDLGAGRCIPCKMMAPILEELSEECAGVFEVEFIDVWENPQAGEEYGIRIIPTQIFYDAEGKELFRHEGFFGKEEILAKWKEYGVTVAAESGK